MTDIRCLRRRIGKVIQLFHLTATGRIEFSGRFCGPRWAKLRSERKKILTFDKIFPWSTDRRVPLALCTSCYEIRTDICRAVLTRSFNFTLFEHRHMVRAELSL
jgi:hypothetical protein